MSDELRAGLPRVLDPTIRRLIERLGKRLITLEGQHRELSNTALKTGSPIVAYDQRIRQVADPVENSDAVTLGYMRRLIHSVVQTADGVPARPNTDAGPTTPLPLPAGTFSASPTSYGAGGGPVTLSWSSSNATSAEISGLGAVALSGNQIVNITVSTTWTLTLRGPNGVVTYSAAVTVNAAPPPTAPTGSFTATPATAAAGQQITLAWSSTNATTAVIGQGVGAVTPVAGGTRLVQILVTTTYEIVFSGPGGTVVYRATVTVGTPTPPPPPPTGSNVAGTQGWGFTRDGVRFMWKGFSAFALFHDVLDPARVSRSQIVVEAFAAAGATVPRVFLTIAGNPFAGVNIRLYPTERDPATYWGGLRAMVQQLNARGMMPELVIFGAFTEIWPGPNQFAQMIAFTEDVARQLLTTRGCFIQIANEWNQIGFTSRDQLVTLANAFKAIDANRPITLSAANGPGDGDTQTNVPPATYLTVHVDRVMTPQTYAWVLRHYFNPTMMNRLLPAVSDEPTNAGSAAFGTADPDPQNWYAFGMLGRLLHWSATFHYEGGLFNTAPDLLTTECLNAWLEPQGVFGYNPDVGGELFAATPGGVAFGTSPWPSSGTNYAIIGRNVGGTAIVLVFGPGTLPALNPGWGTPIGPLGSTAGYSNIKAYLVPPAPL